MSSQLGVSDEKIDAIADYANNDLFCEAERLALEFADSMTITGRDVSGELFARLRTFYDDDALVEASLEIRERFRVQALACFFAESAT